MRDVLTGPLAIAALVLAAAGVAKLRSPDPAARAAIVLGLPARRSLVRALAAAELGVAFWGLSVPSTAAALALAGAYACFTAVGFLLARRRASCGCFGGEDAPAGHAHWTLSAVLALVGGAAAVWRPHGLLWALDSHPALTAALAVGVAGAAYGLVVVYTQLPLAWSAWSGR
jgi:hypothetical protein